jgi:hypothetical protein
MNRWREYSSEVLERVSWLAYLRIRLSSRLHTPRNDSDKKSDDVPALFVISENASLYGMGFDQADGPSAICCWRASLRDFRFT